jgi:hypothetical protein
MGMDANFIHAVLQINSSASGHLTKVYFIQTSNKRKIWQKQTSLVLFPYGGTSPCIDCGGEKTTDAHVASHTLLFCSDLPK